MSSKISDSDLELINLGKSLGLNLVSFADLRASQDDSFVDEVRKLAIEQMKKENLNILSNKDSFYAGSIDFMVSNEPEGKRVFLLETNGGSHRGLSIITEKQQSLLYNGYLEAINEAINRKKRSLNKVFVIIGVPVNDALIHEKVIMIEYFRKQLKAHGNSVKIFNTDNYDKEYEADVVFLIADYHQLSISLSFSNNWFKYNGEKVSVLIGDGIVRRFDNKKFLKLIKKDFHRINSILVNPIYNITDDKSLTYLASYFTKNILENYNLKYLIFTKAFSESELVDKLKFLIKKYNKSFIIKPSGGSGGAGVIPISNCGDFNNIKNLIEVSKLEFFSKFMRDRNPFPYTIQEMADFSLINWKRGKHTFDLRIYLTQEKGKIIPVGGLARIAREEFIHKETLNKQEFVVNLSGYDGQIEVERGIGFSDKNCKLLNLKKEDFVNMFCIGSILFASIVRNYKRI
ncbi:MAG: YheC/YheD family protein, partial [Candidatus Odinarchaeota archaeon]